MSIAYSYKFNELLMQLKLKLTQLLFSQVFLPGKLVLSLVGAWSRCYHRSNGRKLRFDGGGSGCFSPFVSIFTQKCLVYPLLFSRANVKQSRAHTRIQTSTHRHRPKHISKETRRGGEREKRKSCEAQSKSCLLSRHMQHTFFGTHIHIPFVRKAQSNTLARTQKHIHTLLSTCLSTHSSSR